MTDKIKFIDELATAFYDEVKHSNSSQYICNDGTIIDTDVGYVVEWFREYIDVLKKRYAE